MKITGSADSRFPVDIFFGLLWNGEEACEIPRKSPLCSEWGQIISTHFLNDENETVPEKLDLVYLSIEEQKFYSVEAQLNRSAISEAFMKYPLTHLIVGMAPKGLVCVWAGGAMKSVLVNVFNAREIKVTMQQFRPNLQNVELAEYCSILSKNKSFIRDEAKSLLLSKPDLFHKRAQQFVYRYMPILLHWENDQWVQQKTDGPDPEFRIGETLYDGTYDKLHRGGLMCYHTAGKPKKLSIQWYVGKSEYSAYFWFEDERICEVFDKFYGAHLDTKTDFIIRIDAENRKYELALFRNGLKEPQIIPKSTYQLIVFKNKFEDYRSDNYDQPRGAWI